MLQSAESPLRSVQLEILSLLGSLGGGVNGGLLETSGEELARVALAWDSRPRLTFHVPFIDMKPDIHLGKPYMYVELCGWVEGGGGARVG